MKKQDLLDKVLENHLPTHIALILDGNGRWAQKRMLPRTFGHKKGAETFREIIHASSDLGIKYLSAFTFSTENWKRPKEEVDFIMNEIIHLCKDWQKLVKKNIKLIVIGTRKNVPIYVQKALDDVCEKTKTNNGMQLNIAFNYGAKEEIVHATKEIATLVANGQLQIEDINEAIFETHLYTKDIPPVDLMIRTSGEIRLSNYLLWQNAYAEMIFTKTLWPDFHTKELYEAILEYQKRNRRFGGVK